MNGNRSRTTWPHCPPTVSTGTLTPPTHRFWRTKQTPPQPARQFTTSSSPYAPPARSARTDSSCLAHPGVEQVEVGLPAVSLVVLPAALDPVAVTANGLREALVEGLTFAPEHPLAVADAHLVDGADGPVVGVELVVGAIGGIAAIDADAVGRLRHLYGRTLEQQLAALEPLEGGRGLSRPRLAAGRCCHLAPLTDQHLHLLQRLLRGRLIHGYPLSRLTSGLINLDDHAIIADGLQLSQLECMHADAGEEALAVSDHDREDHRPQPLHGRSQAGCLWAAVALARRLHPVRLSRLLLGLSARCDAVGQSRTFQVTREFMRSLQALLRYRWPGICRRLLWLHFYSQSIRLDASIVVRACHT